MNNELKFQHIKRLWYLEGGVIKSGVTASQLRKISRTQNTRLWRTHI